MDKDTIIEFLLEKPGYLKEGAARFASKMGISEELSLECLQEARRLVREEDDAIREVLGDEPKGYSKKWQTPGGEWRYSFKGDDVEKTEMFKELKKDLISDIKNLSPFISGKSASVSTDPVAIEISIPDFHFGKIDGNSIEKQAELFLNSINELYSKVSSYNIEKFILPVGNDLFNSEGFRYTTTAGTPQEDNSDWRVSYRIAWMSLVKAINFLSQKAPVDIIIVPGNHDQERCFYVGETLSAYYYNHSDVNVSNTGESRFYYSYGKNLIGYAHGKYEKSHELPLIMATEVPILFAHATYKSWHLGHFHKHTKDEYRGIEVEFLPSLCGVDEWHKIMGYSHKRRAMAFIWSKDRGKEGFVQINK